MAQKSQNGKLTEIPTVIPTVSTTAIINYTIYSPEVYKPPGPKYLFKNSSCFDPLNNKCVKYFNEVFIPWLINQKIPFTYSRLEDIWKKGYEGHKRVGGDVIFLVEISYIHNVNLILLNFGDMFNKSTNFNFNLWELKDI